MKKYIDIQTIIMWFMNEFITSNSVLIWKFGRIFLPSTFEESKSLKLFFYCPIFFNDRFNVLELNNILILYPSDFYKRHNQMPYIKTLFINFENFWHILRECSFHDRVYLLNGWMDGWMKRWLFERATFQQMLNMASPHTSHDTLLCCKDKCSTHIYIYGEK